MRPRGLREAGARSSPGRRGVSAPGGGPGHPDQELGTRGLWSEYSQGPGVRDTALGPQDLQVGQEFFVHGQLGDTISFQALEHKAKTVSAVLRGLQESDQ